MTETLDPAIWAICEPVTEAQAILDDYVNGGKGEPERVIADLHKLLSEPALLHAMWAVGYFPANTPPAGAGH